ncbi:oligosaccharide flippase family protein [Microterricola pindariensis]|uniref:Polysaccharide biosynthesis protein C-terminal domain-containing protein n=1 Tax=Microterricola pindariensis TaxID=478010 RepID=A0ABX5AU18_9MICO|nr:oligosaccharide flippase family protein [Microterricola pindariensis]PPL15761.1 hypothetical protein GY24_13760 [Microterricola pindariensis]
MSEKRVPKFAQGAAWMVSANLISFALQGVYFVLLARALGASSYGIFAGALAVVVIFATFSGIGSGNVLVMSVSRARGEFGGRYGTAWTYVFASAAPLAGLVVLLSVPSGGVFLATVVPLLLSELVFGRFLDLGFQSFQAHDRLRGTAVLTMAAGGSRMVLAAAFLALGGSSPVVWAWSYAALNFCLALIATTICWRLFGRPTHNRAYLTSTWRIGFFFALGMSSRTVYTDADKFLLNVFRFDDAAGVYSAGSKLITMAFSPVQALVYSANTRLFRAGKSGRRAVWKILRKLLVPVGGYAVVAMVALILGAPLVPLILGDDFTETAELLPWLSVILLFQTVHYVFGDALMGLGKQGVRSVSQAVVAVLSVALNLWLIPLAGLQAVVPIAIGASALLAILMVGFFLAQPLEYAAVESESESESEGAGEEPVGLK